MDTRTAGIAVERHLDALMDAANIESEARAATFYDSVSDQIEHNWAELLSAELAQKFIRDWIDDPVVDLAEAFQEYAKVKSGLVCVEDAARIVFRAIERRVESISTTQVEQRQ